MTPTFHIITINQINRSPFIEINQRVKPIVCPIAEAHDLSISTGALSRCNQNTATNEMATPNKCAAAPVKDNNDHIFFPQNTNKTALGFAKLYAFCDFSCRSTFGHRLSEPIHVRIEINEKSQMIIAYLVDEQKKMTIIRHTIMMFIHRWKREESLTRLTTPSQFR